MGKANFQARRVDKYGVRTVDISPDPDPGFPLPLELSRRGFFVESRPRAACHASPGVPCACRGYYKVIQRAAEAKAKAKAEMQECLCLSVSLTPRAHAAPKSTLPYVQHSVLVCYVFRRKHTTSRKRLHFGRAVEIWYG
jgi:hypothetical protein